MGLRPLVACHTEALLELEGFAKGVPPTDNRALHMQACQVSLQAKGRLMLRQHSSLQHTLHQTAIKLLMLGRFTCYPYIAYQCTSSEMPLHSTEFPDESRRLDLCCAAKVTPLVVVGCSVKAGLQPVPASLAPVQARPRAVVHEPAHLNLHSRTIVRAAIYKQQSRLYHLSMNPNI